MIDYKPFWLTLEKSEENWYTLTNKHHLSHSTLHRLKHNKDISTKTLNDLCRILKCNVEDNNSTLFFASGFVLSIIGVVLIIAVITFVISSLGVLIGNVFGMKFKQPAEIFGGVVLVLIGLKILLEGLGVILF